MISMLTREQKATDYEALFRVLTECYPVAGILKRRGIDMDALKEKHRSPVIDSKDDLAFCRAVQDVFSEFKEPAAYPDGHQRYLSHLLLFEPARYYSYRKMYKAFMDGAWENADREAFRPWIEALEHENSKKFYDQFEPETVQYEFWYKGQAPADSLRDEKKDVVFGDRSVPNVYCRVLPGNNLYIYVDSLDMMRIAGDREIIFEFYRQHPECDNLILDFRRNGGGATDYWSFLLVGPTLEEDLQYETCMGFPVNELNREYFEASFNHGKAIGDPDGEIRPISELPDMPEVHREDLEQLTHFWMEKNVVKADKEHPLRAGKIWALVSDLVYSSSEGFAAFCKSTGWATLVGSRTGGDGIGETPLHAVLPESGLVMRYSGEYGFNADGTSNAECGTQPDIECSADLALAVCLNRIYEDGKEK